MGFMIVLDTALVGLELYVDQIDLQLIEIHLPMLLAQVLWLKCGSTQKKNFKAKITLKSYKQELGISNRNITVTANVTVQLDIGIQ